MSNSNFRARAFTFALFVSVFGFVLSVASRAHAETMQAPVGGKSIPLGDGRIGCGPPGGGWLLEPGGRTVKPPSAAAEASIGQPTGLRLAASWAACAATTKSVTLVATGSWPALEAGSASLFLDEARLEARGRRLRGVGIASLSEGTSITDVCHDPKPDAPLERCAWAVGHGLTADPEQGSLRWIPAGGRAGPDVITFDADGHRAGDDVFAISPARFVLGKLLPPDASVDLSTGVGEVPLVHPEAATSVDCGPVQCDLASGKIIVRGLANLVNSVDVRIRLAPHVFFSKKDTMDAQPSARLSVLHCPMAVISGDPFRGVFGTKLVVRIQGRCARDASSLSFFSGANRLEVIRIEADQDAADVLLRIGTLDSDNVSITAVRESGDPIAVAVARAETRPAPQVRTTLEIPGIPNLGFIPNNRSAFVHVSSAGEHAQFALLSIDGIYTAGEEEGKPTIRGDPNAAGLTGLRFGYRLDSLPANLQKVDLAVLTDPLQRSIREANLPAPVGASSLGPSPLVELVCADGEGGEHRVKPGAPAQLPFAVRDTCRVVLHRERLSPEYGTQKLNLEIEVTGSDGGPRPEGHVSQPIVFRTGDGPRYVWIRGVRAPFDRVLVRLSHVADEAHYVGAAEAQIGLPAAQWTVVLGTGHARLYATSAIPTGLYRFGDANHSGVLSLNFGVISRLTWLDKDGHDGLLGLEGGIMVIGLGGDRSSTGQPLTQVGAVVGLGMSVPIANRSTPTEAAINLHAWFESDISRGGSAASRYAVIFGPSISIGNIGANL